MLINNFPIFIHLKAVSLRPVRLESFRFRPLSHCTSYPRNPLWERPEAIYRRGILWDLKGRRDMTTDTSSARTKIKIDVTSDSICPFCFIGKRKLDRAIGIAKERGLEADFEIEFHPFLLDPTLSEDEPVEKRARHYQKFGKERFDAMEKMMIGRGKEVGINFSHGGKVRQTTDSHRLLALAYEKGGQELQTNLIEKLFNGYFEREQDIGDRVFLASQAVAVGLFPSEDEAKAWLTTDAKREEVQRGILKAQAMGISGVPFFVLNSKYAISGAEDPELFVQVFERISRLPSAPDQAA